MTFLWSCRQVLRSCLKTKGLTAICTKDTDSGTSNGENKDEIQGFLRSAAR